MYSRSTSLSQQQLGIPDLSQPRYPLEPQPPIKFLRKTSSLPLGPSPRTYYYPGGSNRSSTIDSQTGLDNPLNLSQDSGLSPSPLDLLQLPRGPFPAEVYDHYRKVGLSPDREPHRGDIQSRNLAGVLTSPRSNVSNDDIPPPLPPKKRISQQQKMIEKGRQDRPLSMPNFGPTRVWRLENDSAIFSNYSAVTDNNESPYFRRQSENIPRHSPQVITEKVQQQSLQDSTDLCHIPEMNEPFPTELDFSQITKSSNYNPNVPPPPPPRDPRRRSFLLQGYPQLRPVSYSFESLPVNQVCHSPVVTDPPVHEVPVPPPRVPLRGIHKKFSASELHLTSPTGVSSLSDRNEVGLPRRGQRSSSLSSSSRASLQHSPSTVFNNYVNTQEGVQDYWKPPPFPFYQTPEPKSIPDSLQSGSPMHPKQRWRNQSGEDSILLIQGKSSPSSNSLTSRDSVSSEPQVQIPSITPATVQASPVTSLPMVVEKSESVEREVHSDDATDSVVVPEHLSTPPRSSASPARTGEDQPGFSSKKRRSLFRNAMFELEDALKSIQSDVDLLDRAERRDLPTAHQELIIRSRIEQALKKGNEEDVDSDPTSLNTSAEMAFSDMDNFMNWNTSSSFENLDEKKLFPATSTPVRQRTPSRRRSAVPDKKNDDVIARLCRDRNRLSSVPRDPAVVAGQSYLVLTAEAAKAILLCQKLDSHSPKDPYEPDIITDDVRFRTTRDSLMMPKVLDRQPKFGIPLNPVRGCGKDYLHSVPSGKYKSKFNAMKVPDTFEDDMAVRNLRKDDSRCTPDLLGIYKDPNVSSSSCWLHKLEERLHNRPRSPLVFYPNKNNKLMQALSKQIADVIKKQCVTSAAGSDENFITYEDLLKNKDLMKSMKAALMQCNEGDLDEEPRPDWAGKTIYEYFTSKLSETSRPESSVKREEVLVVGHFQLEHQVSDFSKSSTDSKSENGEFSSILENGSSACLRATERIDSGEEEVLLKHDSELNSEPRDEHKDNVTQSSTFKTQSQDVLTQCSNFSEDANICRQSCDLKLHSHGGEPQLGASLTFALSLFSHPAVLAACYCLACLHQFTGLDVVTSIGVILAMISVVSIFFL